MHFFVNISLDFPAGIGTVMLTKNDSGVNFVYNCQVKHLLVHYT